MYRRVWLLNLAVLGVSVLHGQPLSVEKREARRGPAFLDKATIYQVWMRSFTPEGNLQAVAKRLPHIANLGASIVYLSPITLQSQVGGFSNPYRIKDHYKIDPEYGDDADLRALVEAAHKLNLKVILDVVFYHTAPDSVMLKTPDMFMRDKNGQILLGNWKLPRPDFQNPKTRRYFIDNLVHWVKLAGVDGYRCDVSSGLPVDFWEDARVELDKISKDILLVAESEQPEELIRAFDVSYAFAHQGALQRIFRDGEPASALRAQWEKAYAQFPRGARLIRASDNHDQSRAIVSYGEKGSLAASVINFTLDGVPFLYNGQEIADTVATDHQSRYPLRWELDKVEGQAGSGLARGQKARVDWYRRLFQMRREQDALTSGEVIWLNNSRPDSVVSFLRKKGSEQILVLVSVSNRGCAATVDLPGDYAVAEELLKAQPAAGRRGGAPPPPPCTLSKGKADLNFGSFDYFVARVASRL